MARAEEHWPLSPWHLREPGPQTEINYLSLCDYQSFPWKIWGENEAIIEKHGEDTVYRTDNEQIQFCIGWWNADMDIGYE